MAPQGAPSANRANHSVEPPHAPNADAGPFSRIELPARQTSFVGRSLELAELTELLANPDCRLLTIIGPGGIGKTRLALEAAEAARESFADGIAFLQLQSINAAESIAPALAVAIGCVLNGQADVREQIGRFLRPKQMLLVIDNVEHLLGEAPWLGELLAIAPELRAIVTSREVLNLREEWRYPLAGLTVPDEAAGDPGQSEAVRLFVERARQARRDFSLDLEQAGVVRLCRITEGLPLALELAAAWVTTLPCAEIADEIERNIAFLATDLRNIPARHRNMQAAFDHSWALLTEDERQIFQRLAVFRGGFRREAAEQITGATLPRLSSLVDKSLVRYDIDGRFYVHELLRQYAEELLRSTPEEAERTSEAHREFYVGFVASRLAAMTGGAQREATGEIAADLSNIRAAWRAAVRTGDVEALGRMSHPLTLFFDFRARYREGLAMLDDGLRVLRAAAPSPLVDQTLAAMLVDAARLNLRLGRVSETRAALAESEERHSGPSPVGQLTDPRYWRAILALIDGQYAEADRLGVETVRRATEDGRPGNLASAWWVRAAVALWQEDIDAAGEYARRCTEAAIAAGDQYDLTYCLNQQGHVATARGDYAEARQHYQAGYAIREALDDPEGMGTGLAHLAKVAALEGAWDEAEQLYQRSLVSARDIGDLVTMAWALNGLGRTACATGDYATAGHHFAEGLRLMAEVRFMRHLLIFIASAGDWLLQTGRPTDAAEPLAFAHAHPASDYETRTRARQSLATAEAALPRETYAAAVERGQGDDPADLAVRLIPMLTALVADTMRSTQPARDDEAAQALSLSASPLTEMPSPLVEPLTDRELEVLRLIAAGRSNREIADELFLAVNTVRSYSHQLYSKLGVGSRTQAIARARDLRLLP